ncbi:MAG: ribonucleotide-diphosphate reductase subunit beta [Candidatus Pelagibacter sp.]|nr:ribonucleotide-diphosphate reductase subunit beta [Candidatus Pelagibacter sp.]|tara:strand:- start:3336 stop:4610 length:1275 start_codon:yes stop_codon:yes gene_type:complete
MSGIRIVTKSECPFCSMAKSWLKEHSFEYVEDLIDNEEERLAFYQTINGATEIVGELPSRRINSVPQIFIDDKHIGGYEELMKIGDDLLRKRSGGGLMQFSETYKPFHYPWAVEITTRHEKAHWIEDELDLSDDVSDWKSGKVTDIEKEYVTNILRLFTQSDVAVGQNYYDQFIPKFKNNEVRNMLGSFAGREGIHQRAYALLNETLGLPDSEYHAFLEYKVMVDKIEFMQESDNNSMKGLGLALAKSVFNEGVALFASFVMLLNFQRFGKMKGMGKVVEWSIRDESMHVEGNAKLFRQFCVEHPKVVDDEFKQSIYEMARIAVKLEDKFVDLAYKLGNVDGLEASEVKSYIRYITDRRLLQLGLKTNFKVKENPLPWLEWVLNGADHTNFFENRVTEYEVAGLSGNWDDAYGEENVVAVCLTN